MKKIIKYLFPKKSKWIDVGCYESSGNYKLIQMRIYLDTNKKEFRRLSLGFINDWRVKESIFKKILENENEQVGFTISDNVLFEQATIAMEEMYGYDSKTEIDAYFRGAKWILKQFNKNK